MKLVPRNYFYDDFLDNFFVEDDNKMKCDIYEKDNKYHIEMDIPGYTKDEIKIESNKGYITVTAEKSSKEDKEGKKYIRHERVYGKYERSFYLGDVDEDKIDASFHNGTLEVIVPKKFQQENKKLIQVK